MKLNRFLLLTGAATSLAHGAATGVTFIGGSYAEMCSTLAYNIDESVRVELTGSRMTIPPLEICTLAVTEEGTTPADKAGSYNNRGVILFDEGRLQDALNDFDMALTISGTLAAAHVNRGYTLVAMQRWADSIPAFDRGIELGAPEAARAYFNRGIAHEELGHIREAYYDYRQAAELDPEWTEPKQELARFTVR